MQKRTFTPFKYLISLLTFILAANSMQGQCVTTDSTVTISICSGDTFYVGNNAHTQTNTYTDTILNAGGCDSIVTLNLTVIAPISQTINDTICLGDTVYFNGHSYTASGTHKDTLVSFVTGCDSITTLNLTVRPILTGIISQSICQGGSYTFNNNVLTKPGIYKDTLTTGQGCDSIVTLTLSYTSDVAHNISATICAGNSYIYNGDTLIYSGVYNDTLVSLNGCDSLVVLTLNILPKPLEPFILGSGDTLTASLASGYQWFLNDTAIAGDTSINTLAPQAGSYQVQITGQNGCTNISAYYYQSALGVNAVKAAWDVRLYPNPNSGWFVISFTDNVARTVQITDALGRVVLTDENIKGTKDFNLNGLAGGVYFVRVKQQDEIRTIRFVVAK